MVSEDGNDPAIDGWFEHVRPLTARQKELIAEQWRYDEADVKKAVSACNTGCTTCQYRDALERLASQPTVNIEGMYAGYTGPGGKTILPSQGHQPSSTCAWFPDQTAAEVRSLKLRRIWPKRGYGDIEVKSHRRLRSHADR